MGTPNEMTFFNGVEVPVEEQMKFYDAWGSEHTYPHMAVGWTWAMSTPFKWTKQVPSFFGGTRNGMAISWPGRIKDKGGIRNQFHHVIDIVPTILEATGIRAPVGRRHRAEADRGREHGLHLRQGQRRRAVDRTDPVFRDVRRAGPLSRRLDGLDGALPGAVERHCAGAEDIVNGFKWELFDLTKDWTQNNDVAAANPAKLKELQDLFWVEAAKYQVLPLDASALTRFISPRPSIAAGRNEFTYTKPIVGMPLARRRASSTSPSRSPPTSRCLQGGGKGMLVTQGGRFGGWGFYLLKGKPVFVYNLLDLERPRVEGRAALTPGKHKVEFDFKYDGPGLGKGGTGIITVDGAEAGSGTFPHTIPFALEASETFDVGSDTGTGVNDADYQTPFAFDGKLNTLTLKLRPPG